MSEYMWKTLRTIRKRLKQVGYPKVSPYQPNFSSAALMNSLSGGTGMVEAGGLLEVDSGYAGYALSQEQRLALLKARELFGSRFFISPETIPSLWQKLVEDFPQWHEQHVAAVKEDMDYGIPIYNTRGPVLDHEFPWSNLPVGPGADELYAIRPHRFAFAPRQALACLYDANAAMRLHGMLEAWIDCASNSRSLNCYSGNLVVIQRILALSWCWAFLAGRGELARQEEQALEWLILKIIRSDVHYLEPRLGQSAPNNHLLADRFAAWYLRTVFPEFLVGLETGQEEQQWHDELLSQTYQDGGGFEHSAHYHEFACEMGAAYLLLCQRLKKKPDAIVQQRVEALLRFQAAMTGPESLALHLGNGVEDTLFPLDPGEGWCSGSLRELYRALFRPDLSPVANEDPTRIRAYWLLGGKLAPPPSEPSEQFKGEFFHDSGMNFLVDTHYGARFTFRTGPRPSVPVTPGHVHADQMSVFLSVAGHPVIVDAGTYTYRAPSKGWVDDTPEWRPYFAGPAAHNGLTIKGHDPLGKIQNDFRKSGDQLRAVVAHRASAHLAIVEATLLDAGAYGGTKRTCIHVQGMYWLVIDEPSITALSSEEAFYGFQFAPATEVTSGRSGTTISFKNGLPPLGLIASAGLMKPECLEGSIEPMGGWVSQRYGQLSPAPQLRFPLAPEINVLAFLLSLEPALTRHVKIKVTELQAQRKVVTVTSPIYQDIILVNPEAESGHHADFQGMVFDGKLLWVRLIHNKPEMIRWLSGNIFSWPDREIRIELDNSRVADIIIGDVNYKSTAAEDFYELQWL